MWSRFSPPFQAVDVPEIGVHQKGEVNFPVLLERFKRGLPEEAGAIGCFIGVVRGISSEGKRVKLLRYECSEEISRKLEEIAADFEKEPNIHRVAIHHVIDDLEPGDEAIYLIVAGKHRSEVFFALEKLMNRVKHEAPVWKKEVYEKGERWISDNF